MKSTFGVVLVTGTLLMIGFVAFYGYKETFVSVANEHSGEPLQGAVVETSYWVDLPGVINMPREERTVTDDEGRAVIRIASWNGGTRLYIDGVMCHVEKEQLKARGVLHIYDEDILEVFIEPAE